MASNSRANIIVVADEEQLAKVLQVLIADHTDADIDDATDADIDDDADDDIMMMLISMMVMLLLTILMAMFMIQIELGERHFAPPESNCSIFWRGEQHCQSLSAPTGALYVTMRHYWSTVGHFLHFHSAHTRWSQ